MEKITVPREAIGLHRLSDCESSRYALGGVLFENKDGEMSAVATDGRVMGVVQWKGEPDDDQLLVPASLLKRMEELFRRDKETNRFVMNPNGETVAFENEPAKRCEERLTLSAAVVDGRFPKWRESIPAARDELEFMVNADLLIAAVRMLRDVTDTGQKCIRIRLPLDNENGSGSERAAVITAEGEGVTGTVVLMPLVEPVDE